MRFTRGKTIRDPIYLRKQKGDFWLDGEVYENACRCLDQIFGDRRNYMVINFTAKTKDFLSGLDYNTIGVQDRDGDTHLFILRVVDAEVFDRVQYGGTFRDKTAAKGVVVSEEKGADEKVEENASGEMGTDGEQLVKTDVSEEETATTLPESEEISENPDFDPTELRDEINKIKMMDEFEREGLLTEEEKSDILPAKKKRKKSARAKKNA